jgi:epsilon-lactone hydrolase
VLQAVLQTLTRLVLRLFLKPLLGPPVPVRAQRRIVAASSRLLPAPRGTRVEPLPGARPPIHRIDAAPQGAPPASRPAILWAHGGGFLVGGLDSHRGLAARLSAATGAIVYLPDYGLAPEHPSPGPSDEVFAAYRQMLAAGHDPARTAIGGDSAGGALAIHTALALPGMGVPRPAALVAVCPWVDLAMSGASHRTRRRQEVMLRHAWLAEGARAHAGDLSLTDPRVSPLYADLANLPPTLIQAAENDVLLDDAVRLADRAWAGGVEVELQRFPGLWHDFHLQAGLIDAGAGAIVDIASFLNRRWG